MTLVRPVSYIRTLCFLLCVGAPGALHAQDTALSEPEQIEAVFLAGLTELDGGDPRAAITRFSAILAQDPTLTRVRLELGRAYFNAGEFGRARAEFLTALSGDLPPEVRRTVLQFIREIDARRGFEWAAEVSLTEVGDTREFDSNILDLDFGSGPAPFVLDQKDSRPGLRYALEATVRSRRDMLASDADLGTLFATVTLAGEEASGSDLDTTILGLQAGMSGVNERVTYGAAFEAATRFESGSQVEDRIGLSMQFERRFEQGQTVFGQVRAAKIDDHIEDLRDGAVYSVLFGTQRPFSSRGRVGAEFLAERQNVDSSLENTRRYNLRVFGALDVMGGYTLRPSLLFEHREFVSPAPTLTGDPDENTIGAVLRIEKNDLFLPGGFSPFVTLEARRTDTGIDAFSYTQTGIAFGLESRF